MSDSFGLGDGPNDLSTVPAQAEAAVTEARRARMDHVVAGRWPSAGTVVRSILVIVGVVIVAGWLLTALNSFT